jgi:hyperosmotically inducible periplasmic protein
MQYLKYIPLAFILAFPGCSRTASQTADVEETIERSLEQAGFNKVDVEHDRDKQLIRLKGEVASDADKSQAEQIAKSAAAGQTVANEIKVVPPGQEDRAEDVASDLDKGIENNLKAALTAKGLEHKVDYTVRNGVVELKGKVDSPSERAEAEAAAKSVANVQQVVNNIK